MQYDNASLEICQEVVKHFQPKKEASLQLADVYERSGLLASRAPAVRWCGSSLEFGVFDDGKNRLLSANFCKERLCPLCNWRRSVKIFAQVSKVMAYMPKDEYDYLFLTFTVPNCTGDKLKDTIDCMYSGWRYLYNKSPLFRDFVIASFRCLEITVNRKNNTFHPHLHAIVAVKKSYWLDGYVTNDQLGEIWRKACKLPSGGWCKIKVCKRDKVGSYAPAVAEVAKYATKSSDYLTGNPDADAQVVEVLYRVLFGRRLIAFTGLFAEIRRLFNMDDPETGDLCDVSPEDIKASLLYILRFKWLVGASCYGVPYKRWEVSGASGPSSP